MGECYQAWTPERAFRNFMHQPAALFRGPVEWQQLFSIAGFQMLSKLDIVYPCLSGPDAVQQFWHSVDSGKFKNIAFASRNNICKYKPTLINYAFFLWAGDESMHQSL